MLMFFSDLAFYQTFERYYQIPSTVSSPLDIDAVRNLSIDELSDYSSVELFNFKETLSKSDCESTTLIEKLQEAIELRITDAFCAGSQDDYVSCPVNILQDIQSVVVSRFFRKNSEAFVPTSDSRLGPTWPFSFLFQFPFGFQVHRGVSCSSTACYPSPLKRRILAVHRPTSRPIHHPENSARRVMRKHACMFSYPSRGCFCKDLRG